MNKKEPTRYTPPKLECGNVFNVTCSFSMFLLKSLEKMHKTSSQLPENWWILNDTWHWRKKIKENQTTANKN